MKAEETVETSKGIATGGIEIMSFWRKVAVGVVIVMARLVKSHTTLIVRRCTAE